MRCIEAAARLCILAVGSFSLVRAAAAQTPATAPAQAPAVAASPAAPATAPSTQPISINLDISAAAAEDAFDALARQANVEITAGTPQIWAGADPVAIKVKNGRFWPVLIDLCRQSKLTFIDTSEGGRGRGVTLAAVGPTGRDLAKLQIATADGYVLIPVQCSRGGSLSYDRPEAASNYLNVQFRVLGEPGVGPFTLAALPVITEAVDDKGASLIPPRPYGGGGGGSSGVLAQTINLRLSCPPDVGRKVARLRGTLRLNAAVRNEVIEIESPLKAQVVKRELPDYAVYVYPLKLSPTSANEKGAAKTYQLTVAFRTREAASKGGIVRRHDARELQMVSQAVTLLDAEGRPFRLQRGSTGGDGYANFEYVMDLLAPAASSEPAKLTWKIPAESRTTAVPFDFKDLPIP